MNYRKTEEDYLKVILLYVKYVCGEITRRTELVQNVELVDMTGAARV